uniref:Uncharacterized protein n=1 Tax=Arundo donax TaxID=35708 RepID=A0A0A8YWW4_ARUDO
MIMERAVIPTTAPTSRSSKYPDVARETCLLAQGVPLCLPRGNT